MGDAYSSAGMAKGFDAGLDTARQRRIGEQERNRRYAREDRETEAFDFNMDQAKTGAKRADTAYAQSVDNLNKRNQEEGFTDFANALNQGVDSKTAMDQFNAAGELKFDEVQFDDTGLTIKDSDGEIEHFDDPSQMLAAMGIQTESPKPIKLGKDDRLVTPGGEQIVGATETPEKPGENLVKVGGALYDQKNESWIMPPSADKDRYIEVDKQLYDTEKGTWLSPPGGGGGGGGGGRSTSAFNPESTLSKIESGIVRSHGGSFDALGNYSVPGDREIVDMKVGLAGESFARLDDYVRNGEITYAQIETAVMQASKSLSTDSELERRGEAWRVKGWNKDESEKDVWVRMEREKEEAEARSKLAKAEQKMLSTAGTKQAPTVTKKEAWAGEEIPMEALGGATLEYGKEYDVQDDQGNKKTIRMSADGKVYEVSGKTSAAKQPTPEPAAARPEPEPEVQPSNQPVDADTYVNDEDDATLASARGNGSDSLLPEKGDLSDVVAKVQYMLSTDNVPQPRSVATLVAFSDQELSRLGLNPEQIQSIRELSGADKTLANVKRQPVSAASY